MLCDDLEEWEGASRRGSDAEGFTCNAGDPGLIPGLGRPLEEGNRGVGLG